MREDGGQLLEDGVVLWGEAGRTFSSCAWLAAAAAAATSGLLARTDCHFICDFPNGCSGWALSWTAVASALWQPCSPTLGAGVMYIHVCISMRACIFIRPARMRRPGQGRWAPLTLLVLRMSNMSCKPSVTSSSLYSSSLMELKSLRRPCTTEYRDCEKEVRRDSIQMCSFQGTPAREKNSCHAPPSKAQPFQDRLCLRPH